MLRLLRDLSTLLFFVLGGSFFVMYMLHRNAIGGRFPLWWLSVADLPLMLVTIIYGGLSFLLSISKDDQPSRLAGLLVGIPLGIVFLTLLVFNFLTTKVG